MFVGGVGVELGVSSQLSQLWMNASGTAARNKNGHFGKAPAAATSNSPQSQIVPSTSPSSITSTPSRCPSDVTPAPERSESVLAPSVSLRGPVCGVEPFCAGSCETSVLSVRSSVPVELVTVWTTWLIRTGSASAGAAVNRNTDNAAQSRRPRREFLPKSWAEVRFIRLKRSGPTIQS